MTPYLVTNPPARPQYRPRRKPASGAIVIHTTEGMADLNPPDTKAEAVAAFIRNRSNPGSYHQVGDSDSYVKLVAYDYAAFGEGTGGNDWALHYSYACAASQWGALPTAWIDNALEISIEGITEMAEWILDEHRIVVPARRINREQYFNREPGFISHGEIDPERRHDPGPAFPWSELLDRFARAQGEPPLDTLAASVREDLETALWIRYQKNENRWPDPPGLAYWLSLYDDQMRDGAEPHEAKLITLGHIDNNFAE